MKSSIKLLLLWAIVAAAILLRQMNHPAINHAPAPEPVVTAPAHPSGPVLHLLHPQQSHGPLSPFPLLHAKLNQLADAQAYDSEDDEDQLLKESLAMLTDENVAEVVQSLSAEELSSPFGVAALDRWMNVDAVKASDWTGSRTNVTEQQTLTVADSWTTNRAGFQSYVDQLPDSPWKQNLLAATGSEFATKDPLEAIKLAKQMNDGMAQTNLLQSVACSWVSSDPTAALEWVTSVEDPALREKLLASAVQSYALVDPAQAGAWLVSEIKSDSLVKSTALNIVETWAMSDPTAAANWVAQFPDGDAKARAARIVSKYWQQTDPAAAATWNQKLRSSE